MEIIEEQKVQLSKVMDHAMHIK